MVKTDDQKRGFNNGGCITTTMGPWVVRRKTRGGGEATTLRFPSAEERVANREREQRRRALTSRIFAGLRAHGNFPKQANSNDLLKALCNEAGWIVDDDGNVLGRRKSGGAELGLAAAKEYEVSETLRMMPHLDESGLKLTLTSHSTCFESAQLQLAWIRSIEKLRINLASISLIMSRVWY